MTPTTTDLLLAATFSVFKASRSSPDKFKDAVARLGALVAEDERQPTQPPSAAPEPPPASQEVLP